MYQKKILNCSTLERTLCREILRGTSITDFFDKSACKNIRLANHVGKTPLTEQQLGDALKKVYSLLTDLSARNNAAYDSYISYTREIFDLDTHPDKVGSAAGYYSTTRQKAIHYRNYQDHPKYLPHVDSYPTLGYLKDITKYSDDNFQYLCIPFRDFPKYINDPNPILSSYIKKSLERGHRGGLFIHDESIVTRYLTLDAVQKYTSRHKRVNHAFMVSLVTILLNQLDLPTTCIDRVCHIDIGIGSLYCLYGKIDTRLSLKSVSLDLETTKVTL